MDIHPAFIEFLREYEDLTVEGQLVIKALEGHFPMLRTVGQIGALSHRLTLYLMFLERLPEPSPDGEFDTARELLRLSLRQVRYPLRKLWGWTDGSSGPTTSESPT
jgi:hypothetical protein